MAAIIPDDNSLLQPRLALYSGSASLRAVGTSVMSLFNNYTGENLMSDDLPYLHASIFEQNEGPVTDGYLLCPSISGFPRSLSSSSAGLLYAVSLLENRL